MAKLLITIIVASAHLPAAEPPNNLLKLVLERETATEAERGNYSYRQTVVVEELEDNGRKRGEYREIREVIFTPEGKRIEQLLKKPWNTLVRLKMTDQDFEDIRNVQPFLFTRDQLHMYQTAFKGEERVGDLNCWVIEVKPRQLLDGQRLFEGLAWIQQTDYSVVRMEGRAVPQVLSRKNENLFPRFATMRKQMGESLWFPEKTYGDDILTFHTGHLRMRLKIDYTNYQRFTAESTIRFNTP